MLCLKLTASVTVENGLAPQKVDGLKEIIAACLGWFLVLILVN